MGGWEGWRGAEEWVGVWIRGGVGYRWAGRLEGGWGEGEIRWERELLGCVGR